LGDQISSFPLFSDFECEHGEFGEVAGALDIHDGFTELSVIVFQSGCLFKPGELLLNASQVFRTSFNHVSLFTFFELQLVCLITQHSVLTKLLGQRTLSSCEPSLQVAQSILANLATVLLQVIYLLVEFQVFCLPVCEIGFELLWVVGDLLRVDLNFQTLRNTRVLLWVFRGFYGRVL